MNTPNTQIGNTTPLTSINSELEVITYDWKFINQPLVTGSSKSLAEFTFTVPYSALSPALLSAVVNGIQLDQLTLICTRPLNGTTSEYARLILKNVGFTSYQPSAASGDEPQVTFTVVPAQFTFTYTPLNPNGTTGTPLNAGWDFLTNRSISGTTALNFGGETNSNPAWSSLLNGQVTSAGFPTSGTDIFLAFDLNGDGIINAGSSAGSFDGSIGITGFAWNSSNSGGLNPGKARFGFFDVTATLGSYAAALLNFICNGQSISKVTVIERSPTSITRFDLENVFVVANSVTDDAAINSPNLSFQLIPTKVTETQWAKNSSTGQINTAFTTTWDQTSNSGSQVLDFGGKTITDANWPRLLQGQVTTRDFGASQAIYLAFDLNGDGIVNVGSSPGTFDGEGEVKNFEWSAENPVSISLSTLGLQSGKIKFGAFTVTVAQGVYSEGLFNALHSGQSIAKFTLITRSANALTRFDLETVFVTSYSVTSNSFAPGDVVFSLEAAKVTQTDWTLAANGSTVNPPVTVFWDQTQNRGSTSTNFGGKNLLIPSTNLIPQVLRFDLNGDGFVSSSDGDIAINGFAWSATNTSTQLILDKVKFGSFQVTAPIGSYSAGLLSAVATGQSIGKVSLFNILNPLVPISTANSLLRLDWENALITSYQVVDNDIISPYVVFTLEAAKVTEVVTPRNFNGTPGQSITTNWNQVLNTGNAPLNFGGTTILDSAWPGLLKNQFPVKSSSFGNNIFLAFDLNGNNVIDAGNSPGSFDGDTEITSFVWSATNPLGKVQFGEFTVSAVLGSYSAGLFSAISQSLVMKKVSIITTAATGFTRYDLENVLVKSYDISGDISSSIVNQQFQLNATKVTETQWTRNPTGQVNLAFSSNWDQNNNIGSTVLDFGGRAIADINWPRLLQGQVTSNDFVTNSDTFLAFDLNGDGIINAGNSTGSFDGETAITNFQWAADRASLGTIGAGFSKAQFGQFTLTSAPGVYSEGLFNALNSGQSLPKISIVTRSRNTVTRFDLENVRVTSYSVTNTVDLSGFVAFSVEATKVTQTAWTLSSDGITVNTPVITSWDISTNTGISTGFGNRNADSSSNSTLYFNRVNTLATITGTATASITEDATTPNLIATGNLTVNDVDAGENIFNTTVISAIGNLGSLSITETGTWNYTVANSAVQYLGAGVSKQETFTVQSIDGTASQDITITINGVNDNPIASNDDGINNVNTTFLIPVSYLLLNDSDIDGNPLSIINTLNAVNGKAVFKNDVIEFTPTTGFIGNASFDYTVSDGAGGTDIATVTITIQPDPIIGTPGNDRLIGTAFDDVIDGLGGNDFIQGAGGNDTIEGGAGDLDQIFGGDGGDRLTDFDGLNGAYGGTGNDVIGVTFAASWDNDTNSTNTPRSDKKIIGGFGDDVITVTMNHSNFSINLRADELTSNQPQDGNDVVTLLGNYGSSSVDMGGANDIFHGGVGKDSVFGQNGDDLLNGNGGNDSLNGGIGDDTLNGGDGNDNLKGEAGNDTLDGGAGNDSLDGGLGDDVMTGGVGNDTYFVDSRNDRIIEAPNEGTDTVNASVSWTLGDDLENLVLTGSNGINGTGNAWKNTITGNSGDNILSGGDNNDTLTGNAGDDTLDGGAGNDSLDGGLGDDTMNGGIGDDTYYINSINDIIIEGADGGTDTVRSSITLTLGDYLENLILTGSNPINGTGNGLRNKITGNAANNILSGGDDNDTLSGGDGNDILNGDAGNDLLTGGNGDDVLVGGLGSDILNGGNGSDRFVYNTISDRGTLVAGDTIQAFSTTSDILDLRQLLPTLAGYQGITTGYVRFTQAGTNTLLQIDADGGGNSFVNLTTLTNVTAANLVVGTNVLV